MIALVLEAVLNLAVPIAAVLLGYIFGRIAEQRHYKRLREDEDALAHVLAFNERRVPADASAAGGFVHGTVVIGQDYFKAMLAGLRGIFGGNIAAYETLLDRGRREALVRMKREADAAGANMVMNIKFCTTRIGRSIEVVVYGTACRMDQG